MTDYYDQLTIIIISYKSKKKIQNFLKNLSSKNKIIIIENSVNKINKNDFQNKDIEIFFVDNIGYASSINFARNKIDTKYFMIFNPDIENIDDSKLKIFYEIAKNLNDNFACLGPRYINISSKTLKQSNENKELDTLPSISGASMFFNKDNFDLIGGFDENFFLYFEETDYCYRAKKKNLNSYQINTIKVKHYSGTSVEITSKEDQINLKNLHAWHFIWSKFYFYKKHYGYLISIVYFLPVLIRTKFKIYYYDFFKDLEKKDKYLNRFDGLITSIKGKNAYKRI